MRGAAAVAIFLWLLSLQVNGLITTDAKCLSGYEWVRSFHCQSPVPIVFLQTFSSIGQSPCDVAAELVTICVGARVLYLCSMSLELTAKSRIQLAASHYWTSIWRTYQGRSKRLQVQLSLLLAAERLFVLSRPSELP